VHAKMLTARFDQRFGNVRPTCHRCGRVLNADGGCQFGCSK
jgi:tRNA(Ile2) C34 agmatinyltransferase TiaS